MNTLLRLKAITGLGLVLLIAIKISAQNPKLFFEQQSPYPNLHSGTHNLYSFVVEVTPEDGSDCFCLMTMDERKSSCYEYETETVFQPIVYKVSRHGELLDELALGVEDSYSELSGVYQALDDSQCFLAVGKVHDNELHYDKPFMAKFDYNLNLLWQLEVELPEPYRKYISFGSVMDDAGRIFCSSYLYECQNSAPYSCFFFRLTQEGELDGILDSPLISTHKYPFVFPDGSNDYGSLECVEKNQYELVLLRIDQDMEQISQQVLPNSYKEFDPIYFYASVWLSLYPIPIPTIVPLPDSSLVMANDAHLTIRDLSHSEIYYGIGLLKLDAEGNAVSYAMDAPVPVENGENDSLRYMAGASLVGNDSFYFVYNMGAPGGWGYDWMNCFVVGKMSLDGTLLWRRYWNRYYPEYDMKVYYPQNVITSHDNGCLISGMSYASDINAPGTSNDENSVFLLKFFADGTLALPEMEPSIRPYTFFPNPVDDFLRLEFSPDVTPSVVELYDIQGQLVRSQGNSLESINMKELPSGTYTLHIVMNDGTSYSDKVVKQ